MRLCLGGILGLFLISACSTSPPTQHPATKPFVKRPHGKVKLELADHAQFLQNDPRWSRQTLGGSGQSLKSHGCLVTAAAMALTNLGFKTDPGDLTNRLKANGGFTKNGQLIWSGLERVTGGKAKTVFYRKKDAYTVRHCLAAGFYPLVKFELPTRTHWAVVIKETTNGFYIRDPIVSMSTLIPLSTRAPGIDAVRCIGLNTSKVQNIASIENYNGYNDEGLFTP
ncbi:MAG: hypothetical protein JKX72_12220 [Robiginitomaculum sp.]|nr:hypothetical protein [Robiginitomaculum sp.]